MVYTFRARDSRLKPCITPSSYRLIGLAVKASASRVEDPRFNAHWRCGDFSYLSHTSDLKICTPVVIPCGAPGIIQSALGLVGPVSVHCVR